MVTKYLFLVARGTKWQVMVRVRVRVRVRVKGRARGMVVGETRGNANGPNAVSSSLSLRRQMAQSHRGVNSGNGSRVNAAGSVGRVADGGQRLLDGGWRFADNSGCLR